MTSDQPRAMRTTDRILDDLEVAADILRDNARYLKDAIGNEDYKLSPSVTASMQDKLDSLTRAGQWLVRKIESERNKRDQP